MSPEPDNSIEPSPTTPRSPYAPFVIVAALAFAVVGIGSAIVMIPKAIENSAQAKTEDDAVVRVKCEEVARSSFVLGVTGVVCTILAFAAAPLPFVGRTDVAIVLLASCVASLAIISTIFKPF